MDTIANSNTNFLNSEWCIYIITFIVFIVMFLVQKYSCLIDLQINRLQSINGKWEGKPWPLLSGLGVGLLVFIFGVFLPGELTIMPNNWSWPEITIAIFALIIIVRLLIESIKHFGTSYGLLRFGIWLILSIAYFYAGLLTGLFLATLFAIGIIIYFLFFWKKRLTIK
ncbi:MAG: hypothetical protein HQ521_00850 [Bacteroidetes bacterium]|nr:hypothetical protein [Bacteroidota bacterium]